MKGTCLDNDLKISSRGQPLSIGENWCVTKESGTQRLFIPANEGEEVWGDTEHPEHWGYLPFWGWRWE